MLRRSLHLCSTLVVLLVSASPLAAQAEEEIRSVLDEYLAGHATGLATHFSAAFHPDADLVWVVDGELRTRTAPDYIAGASGRPAADEDRRQRRIAWIDVAGDVAVARVELDYPGAFFVDYMTLARIHGAWAIVDKAFQIDRSGSLASGDDPRSRPSPTSVHRDSLAIAAASAAFSAAYVAGDTATLRGLYSSDVVLLPPGGLVEGADDAVRYFAPGARRVNTAHAMASRRLDIRGPVAVDVGTWSNEWRIDDGPLQEAADRYLVVWARGADGAWRIAYDVWHRPAG